MSYLIGHGRYARETYPEKAPGSGGSGAALLARGWADNSEGESFLDPSTPAVIASVVVIPAVTGHFRVTVTGMVVDTSGSPNTFTYYVGHGSGIPAPDYTGGGGPLGIPASNTAQFALVVDLDMLPSSPPVFPIGTPVTFAVVGEATATATLNEHGVQIEVQEVYP